MTVQYITSVNNHFELVPELVEVDCNELTLFSPPTSQHEEGSGKRGLRFMPFDKLRDLNKNLIFHF
jgi:hypothetical protein